MSLWELLNTVGNVSNASKANKNNDLIQKIILELKKQSLIIQEQQEQIKLLVSAIEEINFKLKMNKNQSLEKVECSKDKSNPGKIQKLTTDNK